MTQHWDTQPGPLMGDLLLSQWLSNYLVSGFLSTLKLMRISQLYLCGFHLLWSTDPKCKVGTCSCACIKSFKNSSRKPFHSGIKKTVFYEKKKNCFPKQKERVALFYTSAHLFNRRQQDVFSAYAFGLLQYAVVEVPEENPASHSSVLGEVS